MMGHKKCFYGEIWVIIPLTPSYLERWELRNGLDKPISTIHSHPEIIWH